MSKITDSKMATTTIHAVVAPQPSPPHLGNFAEIFEAFMKAQSGTDFKYEELKRKPSAQEQAKENAKEKTLVKNELLNGPGVRTSTLRSVRSVYEGVSKESVLSLSRSATDVADDMTLAGKQRGNALTPVIIDQPGVFDSPVNGNGSGSGSDTTLNSISGGSVHYSTTTTTPVGSRNKTAATTPSAIVFDNNRHVPGRFPDNGAALPIRPFRGIIRPFVSGNRFISDAEWEANRIPVDSTLPIPTRKPAVTPPVPAASETGRVPWSTPRFRCNLIAKHPFEGVALYDVIQGESQHGLTPRYLSTREDKSKMLLHKIGPLFTKDMELKADLPAASNPVHVFVDLSNITIGFYDSLKLALGIPVAKKIKAPPFSFDHLACVLERGRSVEKRIVAGSLVNTYNRKWPEYMQQAQDLGYEMNILQRVSKATPSPTLKKTKARRNTGDAGWTTSGAESSGEEIFDGQLKQGEQGVDELLHLKMLQSVLDAKPGTAVLATGDAAEAEYSDGFKKNVERLLQNGWNVEIIGWSKGISSAWRDPNFTKTWGDRFRLIELDEYTEELFAAWFGAPGF
jgi:hypothetical protein